MESFESKDLVALEDEQLDAVAGGCGGGYGGGRRGGFHRGGGRRAPQQEINITNIIQVEGNDITAGGDVIIQIVENIDA